MSDGFALISRGKVRLMGFISVTTQPRYETMGTGSVVGEISDHTTQGDL